MALIELGDRISASLTSDFGVDSPSQPRKEPRSSAVGEDGAVASQGGQKREVTALTKNPFSREQSAWLCEAMQGFRTCIDAEVKVLKGGLAEAKEMTEQAKKHAADAAATAHAALAETVSLDLLLQDEQKRNE